METRKRFLSHFLKYFLSSQDMIIIKLKESLETQFKTVSDDKAVMEDIITVWDADNIPK